MTYSQDNQGNQDNSSDVGAGFDSTRDTTHEGWAIDPSDGERIWMGRPNSRYSPNVHAYRDDSNNGGVNTLGDFLRQHPLSVQNDDPSELPPVQTNRDTARRVERNLEGERHDQEAIKEFNRRTQAQDYQADLQAGRLSPQFIYSQIEAARTDPDTQEFLKSYDPNANPVNWTDDLRELFEGAAKMFGTSYENSRNSGISRRELMGLIKLYQLDTPKQGQQPTQRPDSKQFHAQQKQELIRHWNVGEEEFKRRLNITQTINRKLANAEERKFIGENPAEANAMVWDALQNNPEFAERIRNMGISW